MRALLSLAFCFIISVAKAFSEHHAAEVKRWVGFLGEIGLRK